jgi:hypothetical protein
MSLLPRLLLLSLLALTGGLSAAEPRAARSVHLGYPTPAATMFYNEMTIDQSTTGSYFMAAGWNTGYFGLQELGNGKKVVIFSVWDPTKGDDPKAVKPEERVECLFNADDVRIKRFGGEGTGGQCMADFDWQLGKAYRFLVAAKIDGEKTAYSGFISSADDPQWKQLVTFRVRTGGKPMTGLYTFVEDFRRDTKSVKDVRLAHFGNTWIRDVESNWSPINKARFTASGAEWEAKESINAGLDSAGYFLATGGETKQEQPLNKLLPERPLAEKPQSPSVPEDWK